LWNESWIDTGDRRLFRQACSKLQAVVNSTIALSIRLVIKIGTRYKHPTSL
jgi:hypothetical protein